MVNSIKEFLSESDTISEIKLLLPYDKNKVIVVVEGDYDKDLFGSLLSSNIDIIQSYGGCSQLENIVCNHFKDEDRVIGIRDKDYLEIPAAEKCFFYDYSCAEMMIVSLDSCFERLFIKFYRGGKMSSSELRLFCLEHLEKLSKLRKLSFQLGWKIRFDGIKPSHCYDPSVEQMDKTIVAELNRMNPGNEIDSSRIELCEELPKCESLQDYLMITNGHDFVNLFAKVAGRKKKAGEDNVEISMQSTFGPEEFKVTSLYNSLLSYQTNKKVVIVS